MKSSYLPGQLQRHGTYLALRTGVNLAKQYLADNLLRV
jgi:hypothetical protein